MTPAEFVDIVRRACPSREELAAYGLDDDEIDHTQAIFACRRRAPAARPAPGENAVEVF